MKIRILKTVFWGLAVFIVAGLVSSPAMSLPIAPTGATNRESSQLIYKFSNDVFTNTIEGEDLDQDTVIQLTNTSFTTPVNVHVQIFFSALETSPDPDVVLVCQEINFTDFYTPGDSHVYDLDERGVFTNDPFDPVDPNKDQPIIDDGEIDDEIGFVVITPIVGPLDRRAIAHQNLIGTSYIISCRKTNGKCDDFEEHDGYYLNAMGRDAVDSTGNIVPNGTVLDGVNTGFILLQPEFLYLQFTEHLEDNDHDRSDFDLIDISSISFRDDYSGALGYKALPNASVLWTPLIFDEFENPVSCSPVPQDCFITIGLNEQLPEYQTSISFPPTRLCPGNTFDRGFVKIAVTGYDGLENEMAMAAFFEVQGELGENYATGTWMYADGPRTIPAPPPCTVDADSGEGAVCDAGDCVAAPECAVDADCAEGEVCEAGDCVAAPPECTVDADCAAGQVCALELCIADPGGGGGGCAIASTATAGTAAANALVVLIPLLGIGLRSMLRRREED
ncbi:MAG: hypothetical protein IH874_02750 [Candidatus Dadabacteria bacterium]|nr:hypothetical protein [Candidatus Dadabacteria bacterium]